MRFVFLIHFYTKKEKVRLTNVTNGENKIGICKIGKQGLMSILHSIYNIESCSLFFVHHSFTSVQKKQWDKRILRIHIQYFDWDLSRREWHDSSGISLAYKVSCYVLR